MTITSRPRTALSRLLVRPLLFVFAVYLVGRGLAEPWVIDMGDPATYRQDWAGPSLLGVVAVHSGSAVLIIGYAIVRVRRRISARGRLTP